MFMWKITFAVNIQKNDVLRKMVLNFLGIKKKSKIDRGIIFVAMYKIFSDHFSQKALNINRSLQES